MICLVGLPGQCGQDGATTQAASKVRLDGLGKRPEGPWGIGCVDALLERSTSRVLSRFEPGETDCGSPRVAMAMRSAIGRQVDGVVEGSPQMTRTCRDVVRCLRM